MSNYIDKIAAKIGSHCDIAMEGNERQLLRIYAVLCLAKGTRTMLRDVHDAWSAWTVEVDPEHWSLTPFEELTPEVQALDEPYRLAIISVAQRIMIRRNSKIGRRHVHQNENR